MKHEKLNVAVVGCGFVSSFYMETIREFPNFYLSGITDKIRERAEKQAAFYNVPLYDSFDDILANEEVDIVVNLTDPANHYDVSRRSLLSGKHVYTEKPFCPSQEQATELASLAKANGLFITSAPCSLLGPTALTIWKALRENRLGKVRLAYAEMDDGPVYMMNPDTWRSRAGAPWPYKNEFEMGSALEHLGYSLTWLVAFFGPAVHVTAFSDCLVPEKMPDMDPLSTPDFSVALITHASGVVSRVTCGIVAPMDRGMKIIGDKGVLSISDFWNIYERPGLQTHTSLRLKAERKPWIKNNWLLKKGFGIIPKALPLEKLPVHKKLKNTSMDYCLGIYDLAGAILSRSKPVLDTDFCLHINELTLKTHNALQSGKIRDISNSFDHEELKQTTLAKIA
ncbi:MAG: Gfo/Idh/MocA family oxidoreductase [Cyclobacteriaceae bacterium]